MSKANARADDPWTSWAAAESLGDLRPRLAAVLWVLSEFSDENGCHHEKLVRMYRVVRLHGFATPPQSEQSIRSRCAELVDLGLVQPSGRTVKLQSGRQSICWRVVPNQKLFQDQDLFSW